MPSFKAEKAYDFLCDQPLETICECLNSSGPWQWQARDSYWYGDYLNTRPLPGVRVRLHEYPQAFITGPREQGFSALLQIEADSPIEMEEVDRIFKGLLSLIKATDISEIEPYD